MNNIIKINKKYVLILKFLIPFASFLVLLVISLMAYYIPKYTKEFNASIHLQMIEKELTVKNWLNYFYTEIDVLASYCKYENDYEVMLDSFKDLVAVKTEIKNIHFSDLNSYKEGGTVIARSDNINSFDQGSREWFRNAVNDTSKAHISPLYKDASTSQPIITISKAVVVNGQTKGIVGIDISFNEISRILLQGSESQYFIALEDGKFITHSDSSYLFNDSKNIYNVLNAPKLSNEPYALNLVKSKWSSVLKISDTPWLLAGYGSTAELRGKIITLYIVMAIVVITFLSIQLILVLINVNPLSIALEGAVKVINNMNGGYFNAKFDDSMLRKSDQTGILVNSIKDMQESLGSSMVFSS